MASELHVEPTLLQQYRMAKNKLWGLNKTYLEARTKQFTGSSTEL